MLAKVSKQLVAIDYFSGTLIASDSDSLSLLSNDAMKELAECEKELKILKSWKKSLLDSIQLSETRHWFLYRKGTACSRGQKHFATI